MTLSYQIQPPHGAEHYVVPGCLLPLETLKRVVGSKFRPCRLRGVAVNPKEIWNRAHNARKPMRQHGTSSFSKVLAVHEKRCTALYRE